MTYDYVKFEDGKKKGCPMIDSDGSVTGHRVIGVKQWFDENPEERKRLGWIKHIHPDKELIYNKQTHYVVTTARQVDEYTVEDEYHVLPKTEEMLVLEELLDSIGVWYGEGDEDDYRIGGIRFF